MSDSALKVLQINKYHYLKGGSDRMYLETSELLSEHGHQVCHFSTCNAKNLPSPTSFFFVNAPDFANSSFLQKIGQAFSYLYSSKSAKQLSQLIREEKPDIAHLHIFFGELSLSVLTTLKKHRIPIVMTLHDFKLLCPIHSLYDQKGEICEQCSTGKYHHALIKKCNKNQISLSAMSALESYFRDWLIPYESYINHFIAVSEFTKSKHLQFRLKLANKISTIHNFATSHDLPKRVNKANYIIYFGRLSREKGLTQLINTMSLFPNSSLHIVGEGPEESTLKTLVAQLKIENVVFLGYQNGEDLNQLIQKARFSIFPSESYESFGLGIIESFFLGTPPLASAIGGMKELIENNVNGFLFEPSNPLELQNSISEALSISESDYNNMIIEGKKSSMNYSKINHYKQLISLYHRVIGSYGQ